MAEASSPGVQLLSAAARGDVGLLKHALTNGSAVSEVRNGISAIHCAASSGSEDCVRLLLAHGADVNAPRGSRSAVEALGTAGSTPLHFAAANGHLAVVNLLLTAGGNASAREKHGKSPQQIAREHGHIAVADLLSQAEQAQKDAPAELVGGRDPGPSSPPVSIAHPVVALKKTLHKASSNPNLVALSGNAPSHSWMRSARSSQPSERPLKGSLGLPASMSTLSVASESSKRRPSMTTVMGRAGHALGLSKAAPEEPQPSSSRQPRPAPLDLTPSEYRQVTAALKSGASDDEIRLQRSLSSDQRRRANKTDEPVRPKRSPRLSNSLYSPPRTAPGQFPFLAHRPRQSSSLSRSSSVRHELDELRMSRPTDEQVIEDDDESSSAHEKTEATPRRPVYASETDSRASSYWSRPSTGRTRLYSDSGSGDATNESNDRFPGPDELVAALASARRARGDSIGSYASESSRFGPPSSSYFGQTSPLLTGSSSRSSRSGSDPPRFGALLPGSLGSSSVISHTTAPTSLADDRPVTPSLAHAVVAKMQEDILQPRQPGEARPSLSEQISAYGAALQLEREIRRRNSNQPAGYIYERLDKDGTRTRVGQTESATGAAKPTRPYQQGTLDRRKPSIPKLRQDIDATAGPTLHVPSAVEPQFAPQAAVNRAYDSRSTDAGSNSSAGRRSPSSSLSDKARRGSLPRPSLDPEPVPLAPASVDSTSSMTPRNVTSPLAPSRTITPADYAQASSSSPTPTTVVDKKSRFRKAMSSLTGHK